MAFRSPVPGFPEEAAPTCHLLYIRRRLGRDDYGDGRMVTYVNRLIAQCGFPVPLPHMSIQREDLITRAGRNSRWLRAAVDQWFEDRLPPETAAGIDEAALRAAAADMDAAAAALGKTPLRLVGGRGA